MARVVKSWTWAEIAGMKPGGKRRAAFLAAYGDRAKAALVASDHAPGTMADSPRCCEWTCYNYREGSVEVECPLCSSSVWRKGRLNYASMGCTQAAMEVYAAMVKELGLLPCGEG